MGVFTSQHLCNDNGCSKIHELLGFFDGAYFFNNRITTYASALTQNLHQMKMNLKNEEGIFSCRWMFTHLFSHNGCCKIHECLDFFCWGSPL